jgi:putative transposase
MRSPDALRPAAGAALTPPVCGFAGVRAPHTRTHRAGECLDRILILGRRHLEHVLRIYRRHYNEHRPHRALDLSPPNGRDPTPLNAPDRLQRRDLLGGLIHEYQAAA